MPLAGRNAASDVRGAAARAPSGSEAGVRWPGEPARFSFRSFDKTNAAAPAKPAALAAPGTASPAAGSPALAVGRWISAPSPGPASGLFSAVPLFWFEVTATPFVYRTVVRVPSRCNRATALLRTSGYVYVCVDGCQVYAWAPRARTDREPAIPADPNRVHELDLSSALTPGPHVLTVSAPREGFVLAGALYDGARRLAPLASDGRWTVTRFRPTSIVEDQPVMRLAYTGSAIPGEAGPAQAVAVGAPWQASEDALAAAYVRGVLERVRKAAADAEWRLQLLAKKGMYVVDDAAYGWAGPERADPQAVAEAVRLLARVPAIRSAAEALSGMQVKTAAQLASAMGRVARLLAGAAALRSGSQRACGDAMAADERLAVALAERALGVKPHGPTLAERRRALEAALHHPLNHLNESRYDRLGWLPHPGLADSQISAWGVRINPVTDPTRIEAPRQWLFSTDPADTGVRELRWSIGYNIESQMARIDVPSNWAASRDPAVASYKGPAWYRARIRIPDEWAGNDVVLTFGISGRQRLWVNDHEVTELGTGEGTRTYRLPSGIVAFGAENLVALRVDARGDQRGITGPVTVACPSLEGPQGRQTPAVHVLATPLSPCVVLTPQTDTIEIHHGGTASLVLPGRSGIQRTSRYSASAAGRLKANWAMVWLMPASAAGAERPILLVFQRNPVSISCFSGVTRIRLSSARQRVIAVRPWAKAAPPSGNDTAIENAARLWSRAALAVPTDYMSITRVLRKGQPITHISVTNVPAGPLLGQTVIYHYLQTRDEWSTKPLKLAPLPALCSYAIDTHFRHLKLSLPGKLETIQDGGLAAPYRAVKGADRVSYSYDVEPWPRYVGFTSWMFSWADAGVPGNKREMELMASTGANCYRPQHNWSNERPGTYRNGKWEGYFPESDTRTRVQITADYCNAVGMNYMNNIEQTLDHHELCRNDYDTWLRTVLYPYYDRLVPQLARRPFWAVSYDLVNEPFDHKAAKYNAAMKELTRRIRQIDETHLCYIEPCEAWGAIQQLHLIEPTGDPLTMYSFHDYNFRLFKATDRWPTLENDISSICQMWWPAFEFAVKHGCGMHCGEFGGFAAETDDALAQKTLLNDFFRIFDQFGMHSNYYSGREVFERLADGSCRPSNVVRAYRKYLARPDMNLYYERWPGEPGGYRRPARQRGLTKKRQCSMTARSPIGSTAWGSP